MNIIDRINKFIVNLVSYLVIILILELVYDAVMRYVFNTAVEWSFDISYILYGVIFMLAIPHVDYLNRHVRIEVIYNRLSKKYKNLVDILGYIFLYIPISLSLLVYGYQFFYTSYKIKETSGASMWSPPIYPFKFIIPLTGLLLFLHTISQLFKIVCQTITKEK
ncbi:hypothetical protein JCM13304A_03560 [Desulfothermus okinawensis JCM 13304]